MTVVDWLLDSDPSVRWQVMQDLTDAPAEEVAAERARVATEGAGARLLALQAADGRWGGAAWNRGWDSTMHVLSLLREMALDPASTEARRAVGLVRDRVTWQGCGPQECDGNPFFTGEVEPCINGQVAASGAYFARDPAPRPDAGRDGRGRGPAEPVEHPPRPARPPLARTGRFVRTLRPRRATPHGGVAMRGIWWPRRKRTSAPA